LALAARHLRGCAFQNPWYLIDNPVGAMLYGLQVSVLSRILMLLIPAPYAWLAKRLYLV
jgi:hypothetical protein